MKRNQKIKILFFSFFFILIFSSYFLSFNEFKTESNYNVLETSGSTDISLDETTLSIQYGTNVQEDRYYDFSGYFYDITNNKRTWSSDCYLETQFLLDSDVYTNDSITPSNLEYSSPDNDSIIVNEGSLYQNGTLDAVDSDLAIFNGSTYSEVVCDDNTVVSGNLTQNGTIFDATISFTNQEDGEDPTGWTISESAGDISVVDVYDDHHRVVELIDESDPDMSYMQLDIDNYEYGTIEFFIQTTDVSQDTSFKTLNEAVQNQLFLFIRTDSFYHYDGATFQILPNSPVPQDNRWYHLRYDIECGTNLYNGLSADTYEIYIDSVSYGIYDLRNPSTHISQLYFSTGGAYNGFKMYVDAIGYSWDAGYDVGDNLYSLDANMSIIDGEYQVYESEYESDQFNYDEYSITNGSLIQNGTIFNAPYGFDDNNYIGGYPADWTIDDTGGSVSVLDNYDNHHGVVEMYDGSGSDLCGISQSLSNIERGTFEFWYQCDDATDYFYIQLYSGATNAIYFLDYIDAFRVYEPSSGTNIMITNDNTWYHLRCDFECGTGSYKGLSADTTQIYINGIDFGVYDFRNPVSNIDQISLHTAGSQTITTYIDAIGYSWDENYDVGNNLYSNHANLSYIDNDYYQFSSNQTGHYPATYGFTNDNEIDENVWDITSSGTTFVDIDDEISGHKKVAYMYDGDASNNIELELSTNTQEYGSIEFWMRATSVASGDYSILRIYSSTTEVISISIQNSLFYYSAGGWISTGKSASANTWYHIEIAFECDSSSYQGLSADRYYYCIDGVRYGSYSFINTVSTVDSFRFQTFGETFITYLDAVGLTWDSEYTVGDNWYWRNYEGVETFEGQETHADPDGWTLSETGGDVEIFGFDDNHKKVVRYFDSSGSVGVNSYETISTVSAGIMEFYVRMEDTNDDLWLRLENSGTSVLIFYFRSDGYYGWYDSGYNNVDTYSADTWYHIKIEFDCASDWHLWIDDVSIDGGSGYSYENDESVVDTVRFHTAGTSTGIGYIDALGYDWDDDYDVGDNKILSIYPELNITFTQQVNITDRNLAFFYSFKTDISQQINVSLYNFDTSSFDYINTSISLDFYNNYYVLNSSYFNSSNYFVARLDANNTDNDYYLYLEMFHVRNTPIIDIYSVINCSSCTDLVYSMLCNTTTNVYLYDFTSTTYDLVNSGNFTEYTYNNSIISSNYHNGTSVIARFYVENMSYEDFQFNLEVLKVVNASVVNFTLYVDDLVEMDYILDINILSYYFTNVSTLVNFSIYDFDNLQWTQINSSSSTSLTFTDYDEETANIYDYVDLDNDNKILFKFEAKNFTNNFEMYLDSLNVSIYRKLELSCSKIFTLLGTWKYRFHIPEDSYSSSWIYFDVVLQEDNIELISESDYLTEWQFVDENYDVEDIYESNFINDNWDVDGITQSNITYYHDDEYITESGQYFYNPSIGYTTSSNQFSGLTADYIYDIDNDGVYNYVSYVDVVGIYGYHYIGRLDSDLNFIDNVVSYGTGDSNVGIYCGDTYNYVAYYGTKNVLIYDSDWNYLETHTFSELVATNGIKDITMINGNYYVAFRDSAGTSNYENIIYVYDSSFTYITEYELYSGDNQYNLQNIFYDGEFIYTSEVYYHKYQVWDLEFNLVNQRYLSASNYGIGRLVGDDITYTVHHGDYLLKELAYDYYYSTSKFYQADTHVYFQTDETEDFTLDLSFYFDYDLLDDDRIDISFNTSSDDEIILYLMESDTVKTQFTISNQGNNNFNTRTVSLLINGNFSFDRFIFESEFDDLESLYITNINMYRFEDTVNYYTYELNPNGLKTIYLPFTYTYTYFVYIDDILKQNGTIISSDILQTITYERIDQQVVYITYKDPNNEYLSFQSYQTYINYTYDGIQYNDRILSKDIMYVDIDTYIGFEIYDSFDTLIKSTTNIAEIHIDITLSVYSLKIKNEATTNVSYSLEKGSVTKSGNMFSGEIIEFSVATGIYDLSYINSEDMITRTESINLTTNRLVIIQSTYFDVYFSIFNYDGLGLDHDYFRFYINNIRKDLGFNTLTEDINNLKILDYFNATLYDEDVNLRSFTEYSIFIEVWNLIIENQFKNQSVRIEIERDDIIIEQIIPAQVSFDFRFLPDVEYILRCYDLNDVLLDSKTIELDKNNKIVSFGFYSEEIPIDPTPIINDVYTMFWVVIIIAVAISVLTFLHYRLKRNISNIPDNIKARYDKKNIKNRNKKAYDNRIDIM